MVKPIIRHCRNCEYHKGTPCGSVFCDVRYTHITFERLRAVLCKFYKENENG